MTLVVALVYGLVYLNQGSLGSSVQLSTVQNVMVRHIAASLR